MSEETVLYLAGPVMHADDGGHGWREQIKSDVQDESFESVEVLDPLGKYDVNANDVEIVDPPATGENEVTVSDIVTSDKSMIHDSDAIFLGYQRVRSIGTPMEVMFAYDRGMPIGIWLSDGTDEEDLSPWYRHHATVIDKNRLKLITQLEMELHGQTKLD